MREGVVVRLAWVASSLALAGAHTNAAHTRKQPMALLFLDDHWVEQGSGFQRAWHQPSFVAVSRLATGAPHGVTSLRLLTIGLTHHTLGEGRWRRRGVAGRTALPGGDAG